MKLNTIFAILLLASFSTYADEQKYTEIQVENESNRDNNILDFITLDKQPAFPGGIDGLMKFLSENVVYPSECAKSRIQGMVIVKFTVFKDGKVGNIEVERSANPILDAEAVRVVSLLPDWIPGELNGKPVNVWYKLPVNFKLPQE